VHRYILGVATKECKPVANVSVRGGSLSLRALRSSSSLAGAKGPARLAKKPAFGADPGHLHAGTEILWRAVMLRRNATIGKIAYRKPRAAALVD
jgi:hypothetical protein